MGWRTDTTNSIDEVRKQVNELRLDVAKARFAADENDREIKEIRTRLWPAFKLGAEALEALLQKIRDL